MLTPATNLQGEGAALLDRLQELALAAGREIIAVMRAGVAVEKKADASPVTEADRRAEAVILAGLRQSFPSVPCVAEEELSAGLLPLGLGDSFFLIDALDGTKEFICGRPDFTVNIALVRDGVPEVGRGLCAGAPDNLRRPAWACVDRRKSRPVVSNSQDDPFMFALARQDL